MANEVAFSKLKELIDLRAEDLATQAIIAINKDVEEIPGEELRVVLNMVDDLGGAWSHRSVVDYNSRFKISGIARRNFATPTFWTSEKYDHNLVELRTYESIYRTLYWREHGSPLRLLECVEQERFVYRQIPAQYQNGSRCPKEVLAYFQEHQNSESYNVIFNFFYGDHESEQLGYPAYGIQRYTGFDLIRDDESELFNL